MRQLTIANSTVLVTVDLRNNKFESIKIRSILIVLFDINVSGINWKYTYRFSQLSRKRIYLKNDRGIIDL